MYLDAEQEKIQAFQFHLDNVGKEIQFYTAAQRVVFVVIGLFSFVFLFIIFLSISNYVSRFRQEIFITQLVGGDRRYIFGPVILQGMINMFFAVVIGYVFLRVIAKIPYVANYSVQVNSIQYSIYDFLSLYAPFFFFEFVGAVILGGIFAGISGWFVLKKHASWFRI